MTLKKLIHTHLFVDLSRFILLILIFSANPAWGSQDNQAAIFVSEEETIYITDAKLAKRRPNLMLFSCSYGAGHKMASQGIIESLPDCTIHMVDIYEGPLRSLDLLRSISPQFSNQQIYNEMAKKEQNRLLNFMAKIAPQALLWQREKVEDLLSTYVLQHKPDMLISCTPLVNSMLLEVAKKFDIPLLVVTTDIDISAFCYGLDSKYAFENQQKFRITVPYAEESWKNQFGQHYPQTIQKTFQYSFGYPTRRVFAEQIEAPVLEQLRSTYEIKNDENVILVMMGGNTAQAAQVYAKLLLGMSEEEINQIVGNNLKRSKIHLICLCGDVSQEANHSLMTQLNQLNRTHYRQNNRVRIHACPGTTKIAELVSLPELFTVISKPGGSTVNEMIKKKMPMIYHISDTPLDWERGNMTYGEARHLGKHFQTSGKMDACARAKLAGILSDTFALHNQMQSNSSLVPEAKIDFSHNLRTAVHQMLRSTPSIYAQ
jgi:UDP-N-acetylglucosamine:LPS N-acetylglucosamine transferase